MNSLIGYLQNLTLKWFTKFWARYYGGSKANLFYETENDLLERDAEVAPFICHCAAVQVWFMQPISFV